MRPRPPPVTLLALALGTGVATALGASAPSLLAVLLPTALLLVPTSLRPRTVLAVLLAVGVGFASGSHAVRNASSDCRLHLADGAVVEGEGWFESRPGRGTAAFRIASSEQCVATVRARLRTDGELPGTGTALRFRGRWRSFPDAGPVPYGVGMLDLSSAEVDGDGVNLPGWRVKIRANLEARIQRLFPDEWPLVDAVLLAGRSGLDPELRNRFARAGVVHLLAISGFHVGVLAAGLLWLLGVVGLDRRRAAGIASAGVVGYVAFLGFPSAATRAALLVVGLALIRMRGLPAAPLGLLAGAWMLLLMFDPLRISDAGFQLSFAGAAGLVLLAEPLRTAFARLRLPRALASGLASGIAATAATVPLVAWHFERVSLVGIPLTLLVSPLFALAIPWSVLAIVLDGVGAPGAGFVAGAAEVAFAGARRLVDGVGGWEGIAPVVSLGSLAGALGSLLAARWAGSRKDAVRGPVRWAFVAAVVVSGVALVPVARTVAGSGSLEVVVLDVGQGDAILLRTPASRWVLVDAGGIGLVRHAGRDVVVPYLRRRGVGRLERVWFTHPDLDHIGGGPEVLDAVEVGRVLDPGLAEGKNSYLGLLRAAREADVPWSVARAGDVWTLDGVVFRTVAPLVEPPETGDTPANASSVVLVVEYGSFRMLLTGDAPAAVEEALVRSGAVGDVDVLKVGHHGSETSTSWALLDATTPAVALISSGRGNRYGHPHRVVLERLERAGARVLGTAEEGDLVLRVGRSGGWTVR